MTPFLRIAIGLAVALGRLHACGLIHKDLKPANILVNAATGDAWLTGFGIATRLQHERQAPTPPEGIAGTLAYMAPEQTGRMNRSVDARSDLYAYGVTLYELLTGALPFTAAEPMEWVHCHIAWPPTPPGERVQGIPGPLAAIVMKLLAKMAEDRYQTAAGVEADLRQCLTAWEAHGRIDPFPLGTRDAPDRLLTPEKLYGREREVDLLLAAFDRVVARGMPELVLVSGYSGIGKSSVVHELHKVLVPSRGLFVSGKFYMLQNYNIYITMAQALQALIRQLLVKCEEDLAAWRQALLAALGPNGRLVVDLVPALELLIGPQPPVPELPPREAEHRFLAVLEGFLGVFARPEHPLVLFLDDLQWLDAATLKLLAYVVSPPKTGPLLAIGAYRDHEVGPAHPLRLMVEAVRQAGANVEDIALEPLSGDDFCRLLAAAMGCRLSQAEPLGRLVHEKTAGNPFCAIQFLTALWEDRLLAFDAIQGVWTWDTDAIRAQSFTDNVVDLMVAKLQRLPAVTQEALQRFACLGNSADVATLTMVQGGAADAVHAALWDAVRAGLVLCREDAYRFLHDRAQEAAYALIPEDRRSAEHLRVGRLLLAHLPPEAVSERRIADVVDAPPATDPNIRTIIGLLAGGLAPSYIARPLLWPLFTAKAVNLSLQHGNTEESCQPYIAYALILVARFEDIASGYEFSAMAVRLNEQFKDPKLKGRILLVHGAGVASWRKPLDTTLAILRQSFSACLEVGNLAFASYGAINIIWHMRERGETVAVLVEELDRYLSFARPISAGGL